nr:integrase, catalytic region, zinc finger, CCHC-type, peptidase aspartic, catalytic [Tanacetum cinerariifolium]
MENANLKGQIQEKVFVTTTLQNDLWRIQGKNVLDNATTITNSITIALGMFKLDLELLSPKLLNNREAHIHYLKTTKEQADILCGIVKQARAKQPLDSALDFACCPDSSLVSGLWILQAYDREPLSAHNFVLKFLGIVRFSNDQIAKIIRYEDYQLGNITISRVYYVEGLGYNLVSVRQFCDSDLDVAFCKHTCHIHDLDGVQNQILVMALKIILFKLRIHHSTGQTRHGSRATKIKVLEGSLMFHLCFKKKQKNNPTNQKIYNKRTRLIIETIHVTFDEMTAMASKQFSSGLGPQLMTPVTLSLGLMPNPSTPYVPPTKKDWEILFQLMLDEFFSPPTSVASLVPTTVSLVFAYSTGTPSSTLVDQDAPSPRTSQTP